MSPAWYITGFQIKTWELNWKKKKKKDCEPCFLSFSDSTAFGHWMVLLNHSHMHILNKLS